MITQDRAAEVVSSENFESFFFKLSKEGFSIVLDILRNQLYSNKELAVIRELSCNAYDAMIEAGKSGGGFVIGVPTSENPVFRVRDFGKGLSAKEVREIFVEYGNSTKRNSDELIGQKGIGAKCPFAYGDSFTVASYQNGRKSTYVAFLDPTMVGAMSLLSEDETNEPDGLEVIVSVRDGDVSKFKNEIYSFFTYWKNRPTFEGWHFDFPQGDNFHEGNGWVIPPKTGYSYSTPLFIMGNVAYPIDSSSLDWSNKRPCLRSLLQIGIRVWVKIGTLEVSASRESLQYTPQTQNAIFNELEKAYQEVMTYIGSKVGGCSSMYEAKKLYATFHDLTSPLYVFREFAKDIQFKGIKVSSSYWMSGDNISVLCFTPASGKHLRARKKKIENIHIDKLIVVNDLFAKYGLLSRIAPLVESDKNKLGKKHEEVVVICPKDFASWKNFENGEMFDAPLVPLSSLPKVKLKEIYGSANSISRDNYNPSSVFVYSSGGHYRDNQSYWNELDAEAELDDESLYVEIKQFNYRDHAGDFVKPSRFYEALEQIKTAGIELPDEIIGIKSGHLAKHKSGAKNLWNYVKEEIAAKLADEEFKKDVERFSQVSDCCYGVNNLYLRGDDAVSKLSTLNCHSELIGKLKAEFGNCHENKKMESFFYLCRKMGFGFYNTTNEFKNLLKDILQRYPMLSVSNFSNLPKEKEVFENYINQIDKIA